MIGKRSSFFNWVRQGSKQAGCWDGTIDVFITPRREAPTVSSPSVASILRDHVSLSISCVDRLYLNGYVPRLQAPGHISTFCRQQLNAAIASPALFGPLLERFAKDAPERDPATGATSGLGEQGTCQRTRAAPLHRRRCQPRRATA